MAEAIDFGTFLYLWKPKTVVLVAGHIIAKRAF